MILVKKMAFFLFSIIGKKNLLEIMFRDVFDGKELFLAYKNMHFK